MNISPHINTNILLRFSQQVGCAHLNSAERGVCILIKLMLLNSIMLLSGGSFEEVVNLETMLLDSQFIEPILFNYADFLTTPTLSSQILIGLCCVLFLFALLKRTGLFSHKTAFAVRQNSFQQPVQNAHGCRAPPSLTGCL